jgi:mRNA-degrading endonuclease RelE of RelBE toxin-antitoxin system
MNKITWKRKALKQLKKLNNKIVMQRIYSAVDNLVDLESAANVKTLREALNKS